LFRLSQYIDDQLLAAGFCYASINGHDGSLWACSKGYTVLPEEATKLAELLGGTSLDSIASTGFQLAGQKYAYTRGEVDDDEGGVVRYGIRQYNGGWLGWPSCYCQCLSLPWLLRHRPNSYLTVAPHGVLSLSLFARARACSSPQPFLQGRCKEEGKSSQGCIIMRTSQAVIIAVHDPAYSGGATFGKVNIEIARIADYFVESGF